MAAFVPSPFAVRNNNTVLSSNSSSFTAPITASRPQFSTSPTTVAPVPQIEAMRHGVKTKKLGKPADQRKALLRGLTTELIRHGRITTTMARAKEVRKTAEHMIQLAKDGSLHKRRQALAYIYDKQLVHSLFDAAPERYAEREGGYTRIFRTMPRQGDNAKMAIIELV